MNDETCPKPPAWVPCPGGCEDYYCHLHDRHVYDCDCPPIEDWTTDPYAPRQGTA